MPFAQKRNTIVVAALAVAFYLPSPLTELEKQLRSLAKEHLVPGVSLALIRDGRLAERRAFGVKDAASKAPVDDATMFEAASPERHRDEFWADHGRDQSSNTPHMDDPPARRSFASTGADTRYCTGA